ncbi:MAG: hypothetical protein Q8L09_03800 [Candidatus Moranbacteria bacterium]|nr:hypothetical protein [Candidatus Moranbacteria bacterium]
MNYNFTIYSDQEKLSTTSNISNGGWVNLNLGYLPISIGDRVEAAYVAKVEINTSSTLDDDNTTNNIGSYEKIESALLNNSNTFFENDFFPSFVYGVNYSWDNNKLLNFDLTEIEKIDISCASDLQDRGNYVRFILGKSNNSLQAALKFCRIPFWIHK